MGGWREEGIWHLKLTATGETPRLRQEQNDRKNIESIKIKIKTAAERKRLAGPSV